MNISNRNNLRKNQKQNSNFSENEEDNSFIIDWASQTREFKQEKLQNKIDWKKCARKKNTFSNYHKKSKCLQVGDIVTTKIGKKYIKPNGKNTLKTCLRQNCFK